MKIGVQVLGIASVKKYLDIDNRFDTRRAFTRAAAVVQNNAKDRAPVDTGHLRRNISSVATENEAVIGVSLAIVPYAAAIEFGSVPHWTSVKNLEEWARKHGINPYALQRSIAHKGTPAHPYLRPGLEASAKQIGDIFRDELQKAVHARVAGGKQ